MAYCNEERKAKNHLLITWSGTQKIGLRKDYISKVILGYKKVFKLPFNRIFVESMAYGLGHCERYSEYLDKIVEAYRKKYDPDYEFDPDGHIVSSVFLNFAVDYLSLVCFVTKQKIMSDLVIMGMENHSLYSQKFDDIISGK